MRILITGATGNVGQAVIHYLYEQNTQHEIVAGVRDVVKGQKQLAAFPDLQFSAFDFADQATFARALKGTQRIFLLRPPQLADVEQYFRPLVEAMKESGVKEVVFLSVQGAERSKVIPHNKIERLKQEYGLPYIFLRPSYFMQNLTTTLLPQIREENRITLPSGKAKFNWIDVQDIGEAAAILLERFDDFENQAYELTGYENLNFEAVADLMSDVLEHTIEYRSINPIRFYFRKRKQSMEKGFALVMTLLHFLPRLQAEPNISTFYEELTGKEPIRLRAFLEREKYTITD